jgi:DNA polymerase IV
LTLPFLDSILFRVTDESRLIGHLDMDAFFAAVEQLDEPSYRGKPVIVGGLGPRGVVSTASYEARRYGVGSAMPTAKARKLCPNAVYLPPRFSRYREISDRVLAIIGEYTPVVETVSIDEAFFDLTGQAQSFGGPSQLGSDLKRRVRETTGLTCSIGLAPNRFLAKLASELCKPDGLLVVDPDTIQDLLDPLPVRMMWGVGRVTEQRLTSLGLTTIRDLRRAPLDLLAREFGVGGRTLFRLAHGEDDSLVRVSRDTKSVSRETTFPEDLYKSEPLERVIRELSAEVAAQLRDERLLGKTIRIKVRFPDFRTITRQVSVVIPTDSASLIESFALDMLHHRVPLEGQGVRLLGVGVGGLATADVRQLPLFE